jgi:acetylornithine deacetylase/succinyl-diaminopimelate desuccinylase-like protein
LVTVVFPKPWALSRLQAQGAILVDLQARLHTHAPFEVLSELLPDAPRLVSGAGHDAMVLAAAGVPTAMLFARSLNGGVSHCPEELSSLEDIELAVEVLTAALARLSQPDTSGV